MAKKLAASDTQAEPATTPGIGGNTLMVAILGGQALMFAALVGLVLFVVLRPAPSPVGPVPANPAGITAMLKSQPEAAARFAGLHEAAAVFIEKSDAIRSTDDLVRFNSEAGQFVRLTLPNYQPVPGLSEAWAERLRAALGGNLEPRELDAATRAAAARAFREIAAAEREAAK